MSHPILSVIIPTHNRPNLLPLAVNSVLAQTLDDLEIIVVDDASERPPDLPSDSRLRFLRLSEPQGGAAARNIGTEAARGRWVTYLDDDDRLLPHMAETSLEGLFHVTLPAPIAVISGIEEVNAQGQVFNKRVPPPVCVKGSHFCLEEIAPYFSYNTKQTLVAEREVIQKIGGWDETFRSRVHTELFLRLNPVCSILGLPTITYQLYSHQEERVSRNPILRQESFQRLVSKHEALFKAHPKRFAYFIYEHALMSYRLGQKRTALKHFCWAIRVDGLQIFPQLTSLFYQKLIKKLSIANFKLK
ncbi:MAG: glycosyltransferase family 2 protein [Scytonema sp. PMC 1069.18]|nr:glycosyltransferase family 2 protein [Scytonema sp. PMC 1069.18]MEC4886417.1 glycosyltransferase family 2 protein [Scytonema sp. PMC 1070.18]